MRNNRRMETICIHHVVPARTQHPLRPSVGQVTTALESHHCSTCSPVAFFLLSFSLACIVVNMVWTVNRVQIYCLGICTTPC